MKRAMLVAIALNVFGAVIAPSVLAGELGGRPAIVSQVPAKTQTGQSQTVRGETVSLQQLRSRPDLAKGNQREASPRRSLGVRAKLSPTATSPVQVSSGRNLPQTLVDEIVGPAITDTAGVLPPDTMGAVGSTQFLFSVNGRFRAFNKNLPHTQVFDIAQTTFWMSATSSGVTDGHVRYDRASQRWFITEIDTPPSANHILLAVSSGPDLSTASWTQFAIPATGGTVATDQGCIADYDTPGIDLNGIYIGANMFGGNVVSCTGILYKHSNLYVIQKSSALTSTLVFTPFYNVVPITGLFAFETIQGVDSVDSLATGYAVAVRENENPSAHLSIWQINNPSTTSPTLSGPTDVVINGEFGTMGGVLSANNVASPHPTRAMDDIDDRLFSAVIRSGHLWTAHNVAVDSTGNSNTATPTRDAVRWYDVTVAGPTLNQSGTVFDSATSGFLQYWMGTVMVSGQGHVAMGLNSANSSTVVQAGAVGRLTGDALGTMGAFSLYQSSSSAAYDDGAVSPNTINRWGDFTYTSLDPCDDMTMWTTQEYVAGSAGPAGGLVDWGVAAEKLQAPPPATPASSSPSSVNAEQTNVNVVITGTSASGSGFYDTPSSITDPCRKRITATVSGGVTVNSITYTDPTHLTLNISTTGATIGSHTVTITNPDGQSAAAAILTTGPAAVCTSVTASAAPASPQTSGTAVTFTAVASGCPSPLYQFWILAPGGAWTIGQAYSPSATYNWGTTGLPAGTYMYTVWVRDASSPGASCDSFGCKDALFPGTAYSLTTTPCTSVGASASPASPQLSGTAITFTGVASGCPHPLYQFWILAPGSSWQILQAYSTTATYKWSTTGLPNGTYMYTVWARDSGTYGTSCNSFGCKDALFPGTAYSLSSASCASVTASASPASPQGSGTAITFTAVASGCTTSPRYQFWILAPGGTWQIVQAYSPTATYNWGTIGLPAGTYMYTVWVRDSSSTGISCNQFGCMDALFPVTAYVLTTTPCSSVSASAAPTSPQGSGTGVTFTGVAASCPHPLYQFWILAPGGSWQIVHAYSTTATYNWGTIGLPAGTYLYTIWARDSGSYGTSCNSFGCKDALFPGTAYVLTTSPCTSVTASASPASPQASGTAITFTAVASTCPHPLYQFWILAPGGTWQVVQAYSTTATYNWSTTGLPAGTYLYTVWARDSGSAGTVCNSFGCKDALFPGTAYSLT